MYIEAAREKERKCYKHKGFDIAINHYEYDIYGLEFDYYVAQMERAGIYHEYENPSWIRKPVNRFIRFDNRNKNISFAYALSQCVYEIDKLINKENKWKSTI